MQIVNAKNESKTEVSNRGMQKLCAKVVKSKNESKSQLERAVQLTFLKIKLILLCAKVVKSKNESKSQQVKE
jgi:hypothetical protein